MSFNFKICELYLDKDVILKKNPRIPTFLCSHFHHFSSVFPLLKFWSKSLWLPSGQFTDAYWIILKFAPEPFSLTRFSPPAPLMLWQLLSFRSPFQPPGPDSSFSVPFPWHPSLPFHHAVNILIQAPSLCFCQYLPTDVIVFTHQCIQGTTWIKQVSLN